MSCKEPPALSFLVFAPKANLWAAPLLKVTLPTLPSMTWMKRTEPRDALAKLMLGVFVIVTFAVALILWYEVVGVTVVASTEMTCMLLGGRNRSPKMPVAEVIWPVVRMDPVMMRLFPSHVRCGDPAKEPLLLN